MNLSGPPEGPLRVPGVPERHQHFNEKAHSPEKRLYSTATSSKHQPIKLSPHGILTNRDFPSSPLCPIRFELCLAARLLTNPMTGRPRRGLGARIGGIDKYHKRQIETQINTREAVWNSSNDITELDSPR